MQLRQPRQPGTIPARAGSRTTATRPSSSTRDHPRTRGEQIEYLVNYCGKCGPFPRARGGVFLTCSEGSAGGATRYGHGPGARLCLFDAETDC